MVGLQVGGEEAFKLLDKNHDGCLDKEERAEMELTWMSPAS